MGDGTHVSSNGPIKSKFGRSKTHRSNGLSHIKGDGGRRAVYDDRESTVRAALRDLGTRPSPKPNKVEPASAEHAGRYKITYGQNFSHTRAPYGNQAHHLLPISVFGEPSFSPKAMDILRRCDGYDINHGSNIIFLPSDARSAKFHGLPVHNGNHPDYTQDVIGRIKSIAQQLKKLAAKGHKDVDPPSDVPQALRDHQTALWSKVASSSGKLG